VAPDGPGVVVNVRVPALTSLTLIGSTVNESKPPGAAAAIPGTDFTAASVFVWIAAADALTAA